MLRKPEEDLRNPLRSVNSQVENSTKNFAVRLAGHRNASGYTQKELADLTGVSLRTIQNWESLDHDKSTEPRGKDLRKLCEVLRVSIAELMGREGTVVPRTTVPETHSDLRDVREIYGVERQFKFTTKSREAAEIIDHFFEFMNRTGDVPERLRLVVADVKRVFPLERWSGKAGTSFATPQIARDVAPMDPDAERLLRLAEEESEREKKR